MSRIQETYSTRLGQAYHPNCMSFLLLAILPTSNCTQIARIWPTADTMICFLAFFLKGTGSRASVAGHGFNTSVVC